MDPAGSIEAEQREPLEEAAEGCTSIRRSSGRTSTRETTGGLHLQCSSLRVVLTASHHGYRPIPGPNRLGRKISDLARDAAPG